jgi:antitoxin HicB
MKTNKKASVSQETFDEFLAGQGILEACEDHAIKEIIAEQIAAAMQEQGLTKSEMAARMKTSRRQLDRLFDPSIPSDGRCALSSCKRRGRPGHHATR